MRSLRRQSRTEEVIITPPNKAKAPKEEESPKDTVGKPSSADLEAIKIQYEEKLQALKEENKRLKSGDTTLSKHEEKLLSAIKSEKLNQSTNAPIIGRRMLSEEYKIGRKYLDEAIKGLIEKKLIRIKYVNYTSKIKTSEWEIL